ncbi:MAG: Leu/Phe/Val dehydrogenase, partial [Thermocrispum sp.]
ADVLNLSRGMAYKNALAGLPLGGGKAVIVGDPATVKSAGLLIAYGRFIDSLGGRYITACDVGTNAADMDVIATQTKHVTGRSTSSGGIGDPSPFTAFGVYQGMRAAAAHRWGSDRLAGKRIGVAGVGKVGHLLIGHLLDEGASVVVTDVRPEAVDAVRHLHPEVDVAPDTETLMRAELDVFAPCALGGVLHDGNVEQLAVAVVCGAANNQLAHPAIAQDLHTRGVLYAPDYLVNAGGVIHVADELHGYDAERVRQRTARIFDTTEEVLALAAAEGVSPLTAADRIAEQRMATGLPLAAVHI